MLIVHAATGILIEKPARYICIVKLATVFVLELHQTATAAAITQIFPFLI
jgi:hypothetical protein